MDDLRREAAHAAVERCVESGMTLGLGTGKTTDHMTRRVGELLASGELCDIRGIPTSERTAHLAGEVGIPLASLSDARPDLTIDGADEVSPALDALKGYGGALLREKIVAAASRDGLVIVADESKLVERVGRGPVPVEVEPFGWEATFAALAALGAEPHLRMDGSEPHTTDGGHFTADCAFPPIENPALLEAAIKSIPGALECGLFIGLARMAFVARESGIETIE